MTRKRNDGHSTEFGLWLREQRSIDSCLGFVATNLDYIWSNYKTGEWMLIEEKRYGRGMTKSQSKQFERLDRVCMHDKKYRGFHLIVFENSGPDDGWTRIDTEKGNEVDLLEFLKFEKPEEFYKSLFEKYGP